MRLHGGECHPCRCQFAVFLAIKIFTTWMNLFHGCICFRLPRMTHDRLIARMLKYQGIVRLIDLVVIYHSSTLGTSMADIMDKQQGGPTFLQALGVRPSLSAHLPMLTPPLRPAPSPASPSTFSSSPSTRSRLANNHRRASGRRAGSRVFIAAWGWSGRGVRRAVSLSLLSTPRVSHKISEYRPIAASFFTTYEFLKQQLPKRFSVFRENPSLNHLAGSTGGEFVSYLACFSTLEIEVALERESFH